MASLLIQPNFHGLVSDCNNVVPLQLKSQATALSINSYINLHIYIYCINFVSFRQRFMFACGIENFSIFDIVAPSKS